MNLEFAIIKNKNYENLKRVNLKKTIKKSR